MTEVIMDVEAKSVRVGGGALWGDVDAVTSPAGYGTVGGTVSHVSAALKMVSQELIVRLVLQGE
jgi:hypothetical protein